MVLCSFDRVDGDRRSWCSGLLGGAYEEFGDAALARFVQRAELSAASIVSRKPS